MNTGAVLDVDFATPQERSPAHSQVNQFAIGKWIQDLKFTELYFEEDEPWRRTLAFKNWIQSILVDIGHVGKDG